MAGTTLRPLVGMSFVLQRLHKTRKVIKMHSFLTFTLSCVLFCLVLFGPKRHGNYEMKSSLQYIAVLPPRVFQPWSWKQRIHLKRQCLSTRVEGITSHKRSVTRSLILKNSTFYIPCLDTGTKKYNFPIQHWFFMTETECVHCAVRAEYNSGLFSLNLTRDARVRSQFSSSEICSGRWGNGTGFFPTTSALPCQYHSTDAPFWSSAIGCSYQIDKQANSGNIPKSSSSSEIGDSWLKKVLSCL